MRTLSKRKWELIHEALVGESIAAMMHDDIKKAEELEALYREVDVIIHDLKHSDEKREDK